MSGPFVRQRSRDMRKKITKIGEVPQGRLPVIDRHGNLRGRVGPKATAPTASRFTNNPDMKLGEHAGRTCWLEGSNKS
jgi:hypothetical protein